MSEKYIPESLRRLLNSMKDIYYDWLPSPLDGGLVYSEDERNQISQKYGLEVKTEHDHDVCFPSIPIYKVTVQKGDQVVSYITDEEIPKRWPIRLRLKK